MHFIATFIQLSMFIPALLIGFIVEAARVGFETGKEIFREQCE